MVANVTEVLTRSTASTGTGQSKPRGAPYARALKLFESLSRELRCTLDDDGRFLHVEGAWHSALGWPAEELIGSKWAKIVHPDDHVRVETALTRLRCGGADERDLDIRMAVASGGYRLMTWTLVAGSGPDRVLGVGHDQAQRRSERSRTRRSAGRLERRNAELTAQLAALEERYAAVERFAAVAAHQLSEPLIVAESSAIMLAEELSGMLDATLRDRLDAIGRGAARTRQLIDALLADARSANDPPSLRTVDSAAVLEQTFLSLRPRMEERRVTTTSSGLPSLRTEPRLLGIIFDNLIANAIKYGPRQGGPVHVQADRVPSGWRFSVHSQGAPIDHEEARRIFDPFKRATGERRAAGTGLGLTICSRLVERLGGTIGVEPGEADGNVFYFVLPDAV
jgi:PAS domain S-box-containing protein